MIDASWVQEKFLSAKKYWSKLNEIISKTSEALESDIDQQLMGERIFEILSQIVLDVCTHIIAHLRESPPKTYADCMKKLGELGIINPKTSEKTTAMIKMRNIIVYQYGKINYSLLFEGLRELHDDFQIFQDEILAWLDAQ
jgi:uncharacterized protein YutE (UPF0331/DUF86 family)